MESFYTKEISLHAKAFYERNNMKGKFEVGALAQIQLTDAHIAKLDKNFNPNVSSVLSNEDKEFMKRHIKFTSNCHKQLSRSRLVLTTNVSNLSFSTFQMLHTKFMKFCMDYYDIDEEIIELNTLKERLDELFQKIADSNVILKLSLISVGFYIAAMKGDPYYNPAEQRQKKISITYCDSLSCIDYLEVMKFAYLQIICNPKVGIIKYQDSKLQDDPTLLCHEVNPKLMFCSFDDIIHLMMYIKHFLDGPRSIRTFHPNISENGKVIEKNVEENKDNLEDEIVRKDGSLRPKRNVSQKQAVLQKRNFAPKSNSNRRKRKTPSKKSNKRKFIEIDSNEQFEQYIAEMNKEGSDNDDKDIDDDDKNIDEEELMFIPIKLNQNLAEFLNVLNIDVDVDVSSAIEQKEDTNTNCIVSSLFSLLIFVYTILIEDNLKDNESFLLPSISACLIILLKSCLLNFEESNYSLEDENYISFHYVKKNLPKPDSEFTKGNIINVILYIITSDYDYEDPESTLNDYLKDAMNCFQCYIVAKLRKSQSQSRCEKLTLLKFLKLLGKCFTLCFIIHFNYNIFIFIFRKLAN